MTRVSVAQLFEANRDRLRLEWIAGRDGGAKHIDGVNLKESHEGLIGHLNFIHPNWIQVISRAEINYLDTLDPIMRQQMLDKLLASGFICMIVTGGHRVPEHLRKLADRVHAPLLSSPLDSMDLMGMLRSYLVRALADSTTMHGVFLDVLGLGVMLTGDSGVGKSELALELISRGSGLIADDIIEFYRVAPETLEGRCPVLLRDFLEVRGLGVLNIRSIFGEAALRPRKNLKLIVHLEKPATPEVHYVERLPLKPGVQEIMGISVSEVTIPVAAGRNLAVLTEAAVRNYVLQLRGIDSTRDFIERQARHMKEGGK